MATGKLQTDALDEVQKTNASLCTESRGVTVRLGPLEVGEMGTLDLA